MGEFSKAVTSEAWQRAQGCWAAPVESPASRKVDATDGHLGMEI
jgi:hypothetical protein